MRKPAFPPRDSLVSSTIYARIPGVPICFLRPLAPLRSERFQVIAGTMSLQRLHDLDKPFSDRLDELLRDVEYVNGLRKLPEQELIQIVNHLDNVGFTSVTKA